MHDPIRRRSARSPLLLLSVLSLFSVVCAVHLVAQHGATNGEWRYYGGDAGTTKYSPLDQINADNFKTLEVAWRFKTDILGPRPEYKLEGTPLAINGVTSQL